MVLSTSCVSHTMIVDERFARLWSCFLRSHTSRISTHTWPSSMTVIHSSSLAIYVVRGWSSTTTWVKIITTRSRLVWNILTTVNIVNVSLEGVGDLGLVLLSLTAMLAVPILLSVARILILCTIVSLSSSRVSSIIMEVLFRSLTTSHFTGSMLGLGCRTWSFHVWGWSATTSTHSRGMMSILLNNIDSWFHCWWTLATSSAITLSWSHICLYHIIWAGIWIISAISTLILVILILRNVV